MHADRLRQLVQRGLIEVAPWLTAINLNRCQRKLEDATGLALLSKEDAATEQVFDPVPGLGTVNRPGARGHQPPPDSLAPGPGPSRPPAPGCRARSFGYRP